MALYSVDPTDPFLATLAGHLVAGTFWPGGAPPEDPFALARVTIFLPTRRAARSLADAILAASPHQATALPRIEALGEVDGDDDASPIGATLALATLVRAWVRNSASAADDDEAIVLSPGAGADAVRLAGELLALMEQVAAQEVSWEALPDLVSDAELAEHWQLIVGFLKIATEGWPAIAAEYGFSLLAEQRRARADEAIAALCAHTAGPVIAAGSTGSLPATRRLIRAIHDHSMGHVVLPGFDRAATEDDWAALDAAGDAEAHAQFGLAQLVGALGVTPGQVERLSPMTAAAGAQADLFGGGAAPSEPQRTRLWRAALRPAPQTHLWHADRAGFVDLAGACAGLTLVNAPDDRTEAAAIAVALRQAVDDGASAALVTPDRNLARRVGHALSRLGVSADDSAGEGLSRTPAGVAARLLARVVAGAGAADWLALLKHPLLTFGVPDRGAAIASAEAALRGPRVAPGAVLARLCGAMGDHPLGAVLQEALLPFQTVCAGGQEVLSADIAAAHLAAFDHATDGAATPDCEAVRAVLAAISAALPLPTDPSDWAETLVALGEGTVLRRPPEAGAVQILGPLEARLQSFDRIVLGGLNEGVWPAPTDTGPWMSRPMMAAFGLDLPERKTGLAAHDVYMAAGHAHVTLTRAARSAGAPMLPSRWWQRLQVFAGDALDAAQSRGETLLAQAAALEARPAAQSAPRPRPAPPVETRPTRLSVTEVGRLIRDPYAVYAKRILGLSPLDPLEAMTDGGDRGNLFHAVLAAFTDTVAPDGSDAEAVWHAASEKALAGFSHAPEAQAVWRGRLALVGPAAIADVRAGIGVVDTRIAEAAVEADVWQGHLLRGRIDRVDLMADGTAEVIDYKTSAKPPSAKEVASLMEPQLPLEAALIGLGALEGVPAETPVSQLNYIQLGQRGDPFKRKPVTADGGGAAQGAEALARLRALFAHYGEPANGYLARARVQRETDEGDYDHLARADEWRG